MHHEAQSATQSRALTRPTLKTPRAAAIAGIVFSVLMILILWLLRMSVPADPLEPGLWLQVHAQKVALAINLVPFAGIAFLWFLGALRDRLGPEEDRFFATVFFGSALLFLAMLFVASALIGAIILTSQAFPEAMSNSATFPLARASVYGIMNIYAVKMAAVFMFSTSTVVIYASFASQWLAYLGYALAAVLLFGGGLLGWGLIVLPLWVFVISICLLRDTRRAEAAQPM
jgi:Na+-transporting methylmalonyl-CoA/oxaloacetate decarboxylase gamma subunit